MRLRPISRARSPSCSPEAPESRCLVLRPTPAMMFRSWLMRAPTRCWSGHPVRRACPRCDNLWPRSTDPARAATSTWCISRTPKRQRLPKPCVRYCRATPPALRRIQPATFRFGEHQRHHRDVHPQRVHRHACRHQWRRHHPGRRLQQRAHHHRARGHLQQPAPRHRTARPAPCPGLCRGADRRDHRRTRSRMGHTVAERQHPDRHWQDHRVRWHQLRQQDRRREHPGYRGRPHQRRRRPQFLVGSGTITLPNGTEILNLSVLARFLESDAKTNILSTPNLVTLDNEEAKIVIGQNLPFITGQYTLNSGSGDAVSNPSRPSSGRMSASPSSSSRRSPKAAWCGCRSTRKPRAWWAASTMPARSPTSVRSNPRC